MTYCRIPKNEVGKMKKLFLISKGSKMFIHQALMNNLESGEDLLEQR